MVLLAPIFVVVVGQVSGCCEAGLKHKAEFVDELGSLELLVELDFEGFVAKEVVIVDVGKAIVLVFEGNAKTTVVLIDRPVGSADQAGKAKEYRPDGSGKTEIVSVYVDDPPVVVWPETPDIPEHSWLALPSILGG